MSIPNRILNYLDQAGVKYAIKEHRTVFTAFDAAATMHVKISELAKNLLVKAGPNYIMAIVSANRNLDFVKLAKLAKVAKVTLPKEGVIKEKCKVKPGALPAFGKPFKLPVYLDKSLSKEKKAIFASGSFTESIEMTLANYKKLEEPVEGIFSVARKIKKAKVVKKKVAKKKTVKKKK